MSSGNLWFRTCRNWCSLLKPGTHWRQSGIRHCQLCRKSTMSLWPRTHRQQSQKDVRHLGDKNCPLSTKSAELNMFNFGDNVDCDTVEKVEWVGDSWLSTNCWQNQKYRRQSWQSTLSLVLVTVETLYRPGFRLYSCTKCFGFPSVQFLFTTPTMWNDLLAKLNPLTCTWPHLRCDAGLDEGEY